MLLHNSLEIELTTKCTIGCPACPRNDPFDLKENWDVGHLNTDIIKRFADDDSNRNYLFVGCYGDPIYHPDFIEIIKYFVDNGKRISVHTNGSFKTEKWWKELAAINWSQKSAKGYKQKFTFSVDGLEDTNHLYRINSKWKSVIAGMKIMGALPKDCRPSIEWKFLVFPYNQHQVEEARALAMELGFDTFTPVTSERIIDYYQTDTPELYEWPNK
jgi:MoaA/NifB/PqqE/SkfB family radical SAM enzyme